MPEDIWPKHLFARVDESDDSFFYASPRKVVHIDDEAIGAVMRLYSEVLPRQGRLLDLMSSWRSHLPDGLAPKAVVGLGMNAEEMADNPQLTEVVIHDLNREPALPFDDESFDAAMCCVSVQYLIQPVAVFREVNRILCENGPFVLAFSNRCFPMKAVALWRDTSDEDHMRMVKAYFDASGGWADVNVEDRSPSPAGYSDPLYAVWACKTDATSEAEK
jgi:SAM-dependent methyltransferase